MFLVWECAMRLRCTWTEIRFEFFFVLSFWPPKVQKTAMYKNNFSFLRRWTMPTIRVEISEWWRRAHTTLAQDTSTHGCQLPISNESNVIKLVHAKMCGSNEGNCLDAKSEETFGTRATCSLSQRATPLNVSLYLEHSSFHFYVIKLRID